LTPVVRRLRLVAMNRRPVWLLDIDGVVNAISVDPDPAVWPADCWVRAAATCTGVEWPLLAAGPVLDFVRAVHRTGLAEIRWHTTWQHEAVGVSRALDLPEFPVQVAPEFRTVQAVGGATPVGAAWWKLPAAERVVAEEGRALLWTDDDCEFQLDGWTGEEHALRRTPSVLIVAPRTHVGLAPQDLRAMDAFLRAPQARPTRAAPAVGAPAVVAPA
jgi:hypothetical protein